MTEKKSGPNIVKLVVVLTLVSAVVAAVLGGVNAITKDRIAAITEEKTNSALAEVLPVAEGDVRRCLLGDLPQEVSGVDYAIVQPGLGSLPDRAPQCRNLLIALHRFPESLDFSLLPGCAKV